MHRPDTKLQNTNTRMINNNDYTDNALNNYGYENKNEIIPLKEQKKQQDDSCSTPFSSYVAIEIHLSPQLTLSLQMAVDSLTNQTSVHCL